MKKESGLVARVLTFRSRLSPVSDRIDLSVCAMVSTLLAAGESSYDADAQVPVLDSPPAAREVIHEQHPGPLYQNLLYQDAEQGTAPRNSPCWTAESGPANGSHATSAVKPAVVLQECLESVHTFDLMSPGLHKTQKQYERVFVAYEGLAVPQDHLIYLRPSVLQWEDDASHYELFSKVQTISGPDDCPQSVRMSLIDSATTIRTLSISNSFLMACTGKVPNMIAVECAFDSEAGCTYSEVYMASPLLPGLASVGAGGPELPEAQSCADASASNCCGNAAAFPAAPLGSALEAATLLCAEQTSASGGVDECAPVLAIRAGSPAARENPTQARAVVSGSFCSAASDWTDCAPVLLDGAHGGDMSAFVPSVSGCTPSSMVSSEVGDHGGGEAITRKGDMVHPVFLDCISPSASPRKRIKNRSVASKPGPVVVTPCSVADGMAGERFHQASPKRVQGSLGHSTNFAACSLDNRAGFSPTNLREPKWLRSFK